MTSATLKVPQPLNGEEIKEGIAAVIAKAVRQSLDRTCSLNHVAFPKFSAKWSIEYDLDDFGKHTIGQMGGEIGELTETSVKLEGKIEEMPPDAFRRQTDQAIPAPTVTQKKVEDGTGMTRAPKRGRFGRPV